PNEMWAMMSRYASEHFPLPGQSFADLHAALAHAMAGEGERLAILTETTNGFAGDLVAPVARAFGAVARGNWEDALNDLARILPEADRFGGSRAQRDLIELSHAQVLLRLGHTEEARRALKLRRPVIGPRLPLAA
ncbi:MAG: tetratricopeptide repeat protein, partial [Pseudomonadota bacterium]